MNFTVHVPPSTPHAPPSTPHAPIRVSWLLARDVDRVMEIERASFPFPWDRSEFLHALAAGDGVICYAAEVDGTLAGYLVRRMRVERDEVLNLAVAREFRRLGVGRSLVQKIQQRMTQLGRSRLAAHVAEINLDAQLFFRALGFRAVKVLRDHYAECEADAYRFVWRCRQPDMQDFDAGVVNTTETRRARR